MRSRLFQLTARERRARLVDRVMLIIGALAAVLGLAVLALLLARVFADGAGRLSWDFLTQFPSRNAERAGIYSSLAGTVWIVVTSMVLAVPLGVAAGIYLEEYSGKRWLAQLLEVIIANLAGVPSIIYGLLGLGLFVRALAMGRSVLAGAATLALLVLPIVILSTRESLRAVPDSLREGSLALGATRWQTVARAVLPAALPNIFTGVILALSRAAGETAPLIMIGALTYVAFVPQSLGDAFTVLPIQIFNWVSRPQAAFAANAAAGVLVLLAITLGLNFGAIWLRQRYKKLVTWS